MNNASLTGNAADASTRVKDKAVDAFSAGRAATADGLDTAANRLHSGGDRVADAAHSAADKMTASASYVRDNGVTDMVNDVESLIKAHPGKALIGAIALGFVAGRVFRAD